MWRTLIAVAVEGIIAVIPRTAKTYGVEASVIDSWIPLLITVAVVAGCYIILSVIRIGRGEI